MVRSVVRTQNVRRLLACSLLIAMSSAAVAEALKNPRDKESYGIGVDVGTNFKRLGLDLNVEKVLQGFKDAYTGKKLALSEEELQATMVKFQNNLQQKQMEATKVLAEGNKRLGEAFLAENRGKEGIVALPNGLQYKIIKAGDGPKPGDQDTVECNYRATLIDGKEVDSSERIGKPAIFKLQTVIPGWREALKLMPVGSKWQVFVPPELAYGPRGAGREIGPNATLVFDLELLRIVPQETGADAPKPPEPAGSQPAPPETNKAEQPTEPTKP